MTVIRGKEVSRVDVEQKDTKPKTVKMIKKFQAVTNIRQPVHSQVHIRPSNAGNVEKRMKRANDLQRELLVSTARNQITGSKSAERDLVK